MLVFHTLHVLWYRLVMTIKLNRERKLHNVWQGLLKSLELENITLFPSIERLSNANLYQTQLETEENNQFKKG